MGRGADGEIRTLGSYSPLWFSRPAPSTARPHLRMWRLYAPPMSLTYRQLIFYMVRVGRLELPTPCSQSTCATNCATPGFFCSGGDYAARVFQIYFTNTGSSCLSILPVDSLDTDFIRFTRHTFFAAASAVCRMMFSSNMTFGSITPAFANTDFI